MLAKVEKLREETRENWKKVKSDRRNQVHEILVSTMKGENSTANMAALSLMSVKGVVLPT